MSDQTSVLPGWRERRMLRAAKGILLDWDGCIAVENRVLPFARKLVAQHAGRIAIVSNNSTHLPADFEEILAQQGVFLPRKRIFLAGAEAIREVAVSKNKHVLLLSAPKMRRYARELGIIPVRRNPGVVLLMRDAKFTYAKLEIAANALRAGAKLVVANTDLIHPGIGSHVVPETGALLAALEACVGESMRPYQVIGKPSPLMFQRACSVLGIAPKEAVMIGDNAETDGKGADQAGIRSILVGGHLPLKIDHLVEPVAA